jgi:hypothetical protein
VAEQVTVDLGAELEVHRITLRSNRAARFPKDFQLQISNEPTSGFVTLASASAFAASANTWYPFDATPTRGRYVRILVTQKSFHRGKFWAELSEVTVSGMAPARGTIEYRWQAPADDEGPGVEPALMYDLRIMGGDSTTFDYGSAVHVFWTPRPVLNGQQSVLVQGLPENMEFAAALTIIDDAGNRSALSNVAVMSTR